MIEVVYEKSEQTKDDIFEGIALPKNIRQIGTPEGTRRIYIEDYVMTYLKQMANPNSTFARGAILVGECVKGGQGDVIFVSGALPAQNLELDLQLDSFGGETWSYIYQEVKDHFPDLEVVGWFLSRMGFTTEINDIIIKLHMDNFAGNDKVLFVMDGLGGDEAFYMTQGSYLCRQSGYYIYYARNEAMQSFMINTKQETEVIEYNEIEQKDEAVVRNYRKIMEERAKNAKIEKMNKRLAGICAMLSITVMGLGVAVLSNYQMLDKMQHQLVEFGVFEKEAKKEMKETLPLHADYKNVSKKIEGKKKQVRTEVASAMTVPQYYVVQNGDTLSSISFKMYNSVGYVAELMEANELVEADDIQEGDQILIPTVKR